jgi:hypothetical protein
MVTLHLWEIHQIPNKLEPVVTYSRDSVRHLFFHSLTFYKQYVIEFFIRTLILSVLF